MAAAAPLSSEPNTPLWLTCLGAGLFFLAGLFLVFRAPAPPRPEKAPVAVAVAPAAAPKPAAQAPGAQAQGGRQGAPNMQKMDPEAMKRLQDRLRQAPAPNGSGAPGAPAKPLGGH
jgi:hypothetical protein